MIPVRRVQRFIRNSAWAILGDKLGEIVEFVDAHAAGERLTHDEIVERLGSSPRVPSRSVGAVAVIPILGVITQRANVMMEISGGTSSQMAAKAVRAAVQDPAVKSILLEIDSPGGEVYGTAELADEIYAARRTKWVTAAANSIAASAAYWIGSQASEFIVTPSGEVGSIGVVSVHQDQSRALEAAGVTTTVIRAGAHKWEGNEFEPLSDVARAALQERVDSGYDMFVKAVSRGRSVPQATVRNGFGAGRLVTASDALRQGMVDRIETIDQAMARLLNQSGRSQALRASMSDAELEAAENAAKETVCLVRPIALLRRELELM